MNKLLLSAAAGALLLPLAACAEKSADSDTQAESAIETPASEEEDAATSSETRTAAVGDPLTPAAETGYGDAAADAEAYDADALTYLEPTSLSGKDLLGEDVTGVNGENIARIDDIVIDANGAAETVVFQSGGVFGLGGKRGALDYNAVDIAVAGDNEPAVRVSLTEEGIQSVAEYVTEEVNDYSLISEIIGAEVELLSGDGEGKSVVVNDIIFDDGGMVEHVIVQKSAVASIGAGEKYAVDYAKLAIAEGDGGLILNITEEELDASPRFSAMRKAASDAWDKTKDAADDIEDAVDQ
jgi:sporulation protein YlmC with PRC-barrel domain